MKTVLQVIAGLPLLPACSPAEDKIDFGLSTAFARKVHASERETDGPEP